MLAARSFCQVSGGCELYIVFLRQLLHLHPSEYINSLTERGLASLLYRDHVGLKHSSRPRLEKELTDAKADEAERLAAADRRAKGEAWNPSQDWRGVVVARFGGVCSKQRACL